MSLGPALGGQAGPAGFSPCWSHGVAATRALAGVCFGPMQVFPLGGHTKLLCDWGLL